MEFYFTRNVIGETTLYHALELPMQELCVVVDVNMQNFSTNIEIVHLEKAQENIQSGFWIIIKQ